MTAKLEEKEDQDQELQLYPVYCVGCGEFLADIPDGAAVFHCGVWHTAKSPETLEAERQARFSLPRKWRQAIERKS